MSSYRENKRKKRRVSICIDPKLYDDVIKLSIENSISISAQISFLLKEGVEKLENQEKIQRCVFKGDDI